MLPESFMPFMCFVVRSFPHEGAKTRKFIPNDSLLIRHPCEGRGPLIGIGIRALTRSLEARQEALRER